MANTLTAYSPDSTQKFSGQIEKLEFNTDTAGTSDPVIITGDCMADGVAVNMVDISAATARSNAGRPHSTDVTCEFILTTLGEAGGNTFMNELTQNAIAWVRVTWIGGETMVFDSGVNDVACLEFRAESDFGDKTRPAGWKLTGEMTYSKANISIS